MRQPHSVSTHPNISEQLRLHKVFSWPKDQLPGLLTLPFFILFVVTNSVGFSEISSFFKNAFQRGPASLSFWMILAAASGLIWLINDLLFSSLRRKPTIYKFKRLPLWSAAIKASLLSFCALSFWLALFIYIAGQLFVTPAETHNWSIFLLLEIIALAWTGYLMFSYQSLATQPLINLWRRVSITGYFDKKKYRMGDTIRFQMRDRLTMTDKNLYRVHFQFVDEYQWAGKGPKVKLVRHVRYHDFEDVTGIELHKGLHLSTLTPKKRNLQGNHFSRDYPEYWEILVEEHDGPFYARFFVGME